MLNSNHFEAIAMAARQIRVSPSSGEQELISFIAAAWDRSDADVVLDGFRRSIATLMSECQQWVEFRGQTPVSAAPMKTLLMRLAAGESVSDREIEEISDALGVSAIALIELRDRLKS